MAWVDPAAADTSTVLASGADALAEYQRALDEWRVLTAAALVGPGRRDDDDRRGVRQDPLHAGCADLDAAGHLASACQHGHHRAGRPQPGPARRVVLDNEPDERPELAPSAFVFMAEEAAKAATMAVHVQGGLGCFGRGRRDRLSGARPRLGAGRRRPRRQRQVHRRDRRRRESRSGKDGIWISHESSSPTTIRPSSTRSATSCRSHVTDDVIRRDRETGDNFDEGVHLALGARATWRRSGSRSPTAASPGCAGASGNWRSAGRMSRG